MSSPRTHITIDSCLSRFCVRVEMVGKELSVSVFSNDLLVAHDSRIDVLDELIDELKKLKEEITNKMSRLVSDK